MFYRLSLSSLLWGMSPFSFVVMATMMTAAKIRLAKTPKKNLFN